MGSTDDGDGSPTVAERPGAKDAQEIAGSSEATEVLPPSLPGPGNVIVSLDPPPTVTLGASTIADRPDLLGVGSATGTGPSLSAKLADQTFARTPSLAGASLSERSQTSAADAMRDEEVERTRLFIMLGWGISLASVGAVPMLPAPRWSQIAMVAAMLLGIVVSFFFRRRFRDPTTYTEKALLQLSVMSVVNAHVAIIYFGAYTLCPLIVVVGIHFVARTEAERAARWIFATALVAYSALVIPLIAGVDDPGVFATDAVLSLSTKLIGAAFVLGTYVLAYSTARAFRRASLASIDELARATKIASQREALMQELRADLERALRIGGPGRYTDQQVGSFKLGVVLGRGAMGEVYEAVHTTTNEPAAVKLLRREILADPTQVARFLREARAGGVLRSPYVVRVIEASQPGADLPYLAMEKLHGSTLAEMLRRESRLAAAAVVELATHVGAGLDAAAAAKIVHRDLKPQNLFRTQADEWKILDFGVATLADESGDLTQGGIVGTPSYMAPEQAQGKPVDAHADLYALAAVVYRCLTGQHPYNGPDTPALLYAVVHRMPVKPSALADLPFDIDACLAIGMAKSPTDRFPTGEAFAQALTSALAGRLDAKARKRGESLMRKQPWDDAP